MLKLIIEIQLLWVPEVAWLLQLWRPTMLLHAVWCISILNLLHLIHILELHAFRIFTKTDLAIEILILLFWEVISSL